MNFKILSTAVLAALVACSTPPRTTPLTDKSVEPPLKVRAVDIECDPHPETLVIVTASGGGTRAAVLELGTLEALSEIEVKNARIVSPGCASTLPAEKSNMLNEIDMISSVSGGSVTSATFALRGEAGFKGLDEFLRQDGGSVLALSYLNPKNSIGNWTDARAQIDVLADWFSSDKLVGDSTYAAVQQRRPYLVLNAADMGQGTHFPFTQGQFDLICSDLSKFPMSDAIAASAAFPFAFSPLTLRNWSRSPECGGANGVAVSEAVANWLDDETESGATYDQIDIYRKAVKERSYLGDDKNTPDGYTTCTDDLRDLQDKREEKGHPIEPHTLLGPCKRYVHLLDGGIADNLGISEPLWMMTSDLAAPGYYDALKSGRIKNIILIAINARQERPALIDASSETPGWIAQAAAVTGTAIDAESDLLLVRLQSEITSLIKDEEQREKAAAEEAARAGVAGAARDLATIQAENKAADTVLGHLNYFPIGIDFDFIQPVGNGPNDKKIARKLRNYFKALPTTWWLDRGQIDVLLDLPRCMLNASPKFREALLKVYRDVDFSPFNPACYDNLIDRVAKEDVRQRSLIELQKRRVEQQKKRS